ncbi:MAG TPA: YkvA family protein [Burkholderiales bacterium]
MIDFQALRQRARQLKIELIALALAARHPRTPWHAKLVIAGCVAYALTPVDFIPDAIPVVGLIDDLIFIPLAVALAVRFVPASVLSECRARSAEIDARAPRLSRTSCLLIGAAWGTVVVLIAVWTVK